MQCVYLHKCGERCADAACSAVAVSDNSEYSDVAVSGNSECSGAAVSKFSTVLHITKQNRANLTTRIIKALSCKSNFIGAESKECGVPGVHEIQKGKSNGRVSVLHPQEDRNKPKLTAKCQRKYDKTRLLFPWQTKRVLTQLVAVKVLAVKITHQHKVNATPRERGPHREDVGVRVSEA